MLLFERRLQPVRFTLGDPLKVIVSVEIVRVSPMVKMQESSIMPSPPLVVVKEPG